MTEWEKMKEFANGAMERQLYKWLLNPAGLESDRG